MKRAEKFIIDKTHGFHKISAVERTIPHQELSLIKTRVTDLGADTFTRLALHGIDAMGLTCAQGLSVVLSLQRHMLYKSMTTYADHRVWQDVYHAPCPNGKTAYIKLTVHSGATVIQFKEK